MSVNRTAPNTFVTAPGDIIDLGGSFRKATIGISAKVANSRTITINLKSGQDAPLLQRAAFHVAAFSAADGSAFAVTGGTTGLVAGATGAILPLVAKKWFLIMPDASGLAVLTYTDTASEAVYLGVIGGNGQIAAMSANLA